MKTTRLTLFTITNMKRAFAIAIVVGAYLPGLQAQTCSGGAKDHRSEFPTTKWGLTIYACVHGAYEPSIGSNQSISWGIKNTTSDTLEVSFTKVYTFRNNKVIERSTLWGGMPITVKPGQTAYGGNFTGDLSLNDNFFKEDCECPGEFKRVKSLSVRNVEIVNVAERRRQQEKEEWMRQSQQRAEQARREKEEQERAEREKKEEEERDKETRRDAAARERAKSLGDEPEGAGEEKKGYTPPPPTANDNIASYHREKAAEKQQQGSETVQTFTTLAKDLSALKSDPEDREHSEGGSFHLFTSFGLGVLHTGGQMAQKFMVEDFKQTNYNWGGGTQYFREESSDSVIRSVVVPGLSITAGMDLFSSRHFTIGAVGHMNIGYWFGGSSAVTGHSRSFSQTIIQYGVNGLMAVGAPGFKLLAGYGFSSTQTSYTKETSMDLGDFETSTPGVWKEDYLKTETESVDSDVAYGNRLIGLRRSSDDQTVHADLLFNFVAPKGERSDGQKKSSDKRPFGLALVVTAVDFLRVELSYTRTRANWYDKDPVTFVVVTCALQFDSFSRPYRTK